jgi:hypothetical protein
MPQKVVCHNFWLDDGQSGFASPMSYYIFMTELIDLRQVSEEEPMVQRLPRCRFAGDAQAFGREPNALRHRCN